MFKNCDSVIFDLDGTLWDSTDGIVGTWGCVLKNHPEIDRKPVTAQDLAANFGLPLYTIAANMFPDLPEKTRNALMDECCELENTYLSEHGGRLFENELPALESLSRFLPLFIVSNCQNGYIESFYSGNKTGRYFTDCECSGRTGLTKGENIIRVMLRNNLKTPVFIGDTQGDADAAHYAGIPFIFAAYGFGKVKNCDARLDKISDLPELIFKNR